MSPALVPRQTEEEIIVVDGDPNWWYSRTAQIVKWSILAAILLFFVLWFVGGYWHAKRRLRKGLPLMKYHRFLVPHQYRSQTHNDLNFYRTGDDVYPMANMPPPPPGYDPNAPMPPTYQPPDHMSKVNPNQAYDVPPPGNPPQEEAQLPPRPSPASSLVSKAGKVFGKFSRK